LSKVIICVVCFILGLLPVVISTFVRNHFGRDAKLKVSGSYVFGFLVAIFVYVSIVPIGENDATVALFAAFALSHVFIIFSDIVGGK
jgi:hypothetical protein